MSVRWKVKNFTSSYRKSNQKNLRNPFCPQWLLSQFCEVKRFFNYGTGASFWLADVTSKGIWSFSQTDEFARI